MKRPPKAPAKQGRALIPINWEDFDKLCALQCTLEEISGWFHCSPDTIERAVLREKGESFAAYFAKKRGAGRVSLRRAQYQTALKGNAALLIWLGKQWLGQQEPTHHMHLKHEDAKPTDEFSREELKAIIRRGNAADATSASSH